MLFPIRCDCGHEGFASLPRRLRCHQCAATKYFKADDGVPVVPKEPEAEAEQLEADTADWIRAYQSTVWPRSDPTM
jgi:hypothetical protein